MKKSDYAVSPGRKTGICFLVGAGPGDPGLLTLAAVARLQVAEVLVYDYLANPAFLAYCPDACEKIYAGKSAGNHTFTQEEINALLVEKTALGKTVVRLKGGDPFVFGRGGEEALALRKAGLAFEVVPGISSAIAGPAYAGIPVTNRSETACVTFVTGHEDPAREKTRIPYEALAATGGTVVFLMGAERCGAITERLIEAGMRADFPAAMIQWATLPKQRTLLATAGTLAELAKEAGLGAPAIMVFGEVAALREELGWFEKRPLFGKKVVVTRTREQSGVLSAQLLALGAEVLEIPTIRVEAPEDSAAFFSMVRDAHSYEWLVFTSPRGVERFFEAFDALFGDLREIGGCRIAAVGPATAGALRAARLKVDLLPKESTADAMVAEWKEHGDVENLKMLVIRPAQVRTDVAGALSAAGAIVDEGIAYRTLPASAADTSDWERFQKEGADWITFTSASTVENFFAMQPNIQEGTKLLSIGPVTSTALLEVGRAASVEARQHDIPGMMEALMASVLSTT